MVLDSSVLGADFKSDWSFSDGDLNIVMGEDNLIQSIINRLNTRLGSLDLFYAEYGSKLTSFFGWKKIDDTVHFMEMEITDTLKQDPRCTSFDININTNNDRLIIELNITIDTEEELSFNLVLNENYRVNILNNEVEINDSD